MCAHSPLTVPSFRIPSLHHRPRRPRTSRSQYLETAPHDAPCEPIVLTGLAFRDSARSPDTRVHEFGIEPSSAADCWYASHQTTCRRPPLACRPSASPQTTIFLDPACCTNEPSGLPFLRVSVRQVVRCFSPMLECMFLLEFFQRLLQVPFEALCLRHQLLCRGGVRPLHPPQSLLRQAARYFRKMMRRRVQILCFCIISNPHFATRGHGLPIHLTFQEGDNLFLRGLLEHPAIPFEIIVAAREVNRQQLARLQKFHLLPIHLFAQSVNDGRLCIFRRQRRHDFSHGCRQIHRYWRMQTLRVFHPDCSMQYPEVRSRRRLVKRPLEIKRQRQPLERHVDLLSALPIALRHTGLITLKRF